MKREFYLQDDQSNKFWTVEVVDNAVLTTNGRIGAKPREKRSDYGDLAAANTQADKEILAKRRKGYIEGNLAKVPEYDPKLPPRFVAINHDDYHARYVGKTSTGKLFFLTRPFAPSIGEAVGGNYIALYLFDEFGLLTEAQVYDERQEGLRTETAVDEFVQGLLAQLGKYKFGNIRVAPFSLQKFGRTFGLVFDAGDGEGEDDEDSGAWVNVLPGDYMAFYPPWDGDYDT